MSWIVGVLIVLFFVGAGAGMEFLIPSDEDDVESILGSVGHTQP